MLLDARGTCARQAFVPAMEDAGGLPPHLVRWPKIAVAEPAFVLYCADVVGALLIVALTLSFFSSAGDRLQPEIIAGAGLFALAWSVCAQMQDLYGSQAMLGGLRDLLRRGVTTFAVALALVLSAAFAADALPGVPRSALLISAAGALAWTALVRVFWRQVWHRQVLAGGRVERVLVLADTMAAARVLGRRLEVESGSSVGIAACAAFPGTADAPTLDWVEAASRSGAIDRVIMCGGTAAMPYLNSVLARLARVAIDVSVLPDLDALRAPVLKVDRIGMLPAIELDFRPLTPLQTLIKRAEDLVIGGLITLFVLPVLVAVAIAIRLDSPGPILFRQKRAGFNDQVFEVLKFRTMYERARDDLATRQTSRKDPRVTRIGRFLRRTSLDELPQLFNVLAGEMSIVGPRPHALGMTSVGLPLHDVIEDYSARHRLKPGITGWAQINGSRGEVTSHDTLRRRVALDCYYIEHWSLRLDLWIILRTAATVLFDRNAY